ncbi:unnamed protein product [Echinostoma caproni]|uniref:Uncharacterized protein n=1 Tax=Echinostoma caproni TaxID=27848 RepID=A0A183AD12_9TREM|nr:unnamed protein product [Echinostoma caproni]
MQSAQCKTKGEQLDLPCTTGATLSSILADREHAALQQLNQNSTKFNQTGTLKFGIQTILNESCSAMTQPPTIPVLDRLAPPASPHPPPSQISSLQPLTLRPLPPSAPPPPESTLSSSLPGSSGLSYWDTDSPADDPDTPCDLSLSGNGLNQQVNTFVESPTWPDSTSSCESARPTLSSRFLAFRSSVNGLSNLLVDADREPDDEEDASSWDSGRPTTSSSVPTSSQFVGTQMQPPAPPGPSPAVSRSITSRMEQDLLRALDVLTASSTASSTSPSSCPSSTQPTNGAAAAAAAAAAAVVAAAALVRTDTGHQTTAQSTRIPWSSVIRDVSCLFVYLILNPILTAFVQFHPGIINFSR